MTSNIITCDTTSKYFVFVSEYVLESNRRLYK